MSVVNKMPSNINNIRFHTGNIVTWSRLKKKLTQNATEELTQCMSDTLKNWISIEKPDNVENMKNLVCRNEKFIEKIKENERNDLKLTVKIFLYNMDFDALRTAFDVALEELQTEFIETIILSVPEEYRSSDSLYSYWQVLEKLVDEKKVLTLGVSNLNVDQLDNLYNIAIIKPSLNQVNITSCCVIPPELSQYAKDHDIQLNSHHDVDLLSDESILQQIISESSSSNEHTMGWKASWVTRYNIVIKDRGVIQSKGYIVDISRDADQLQ